MEFVLWRGLSTKLIISPPIRTHHACIPTNQIRSLDFLDPLMHALIAITRAEEGWFTVSESGLVARLGEGIHSEIS